MSILDIDGIVAPISDEQPCGLSKESGDIDVLNEFAFIQEAGDTARKIEKSRSELMLLPPAMRAEIIQELEGRPNDPKRDPEWGKVADDCQRVLATVSKDTRVASWLIEAAGRAFGFCGLAEAIEASIRLLETYNNQLHPADPDDPLYAIGFLDRLNSSASLISGLHQIPVSRDCPVSFSCKGMARHLEGMNDEDVQEMRAAGVLTHADIDTLADACPVDQRQEFLGHISQAIEAAARLDDLLTDLSGKKLYGFSTILNELKSIQAWFADLLPLNNESTSSSSDAASQSEEQASDDNAVAMGGAAAVTKAAIANREDALKSLLKVADYFRRTEPHSPLSYALEQAVRWGKMGLPDLLDDLVADKSVLGEIYKRMGIQVKNDYEE